MKHPDHGFHSRRRHTPQQRAELLTQYHRGGLTQREFVRRYGLGLSTLTKWLREEPRTGGPPPGRAGAAFFEEVKLNSKLEPTGWAAEVALADGAVLRLRAQADAAWAAELLQTLRRPC